MPEAARFKIFYVVGALKQKAQRTVGFCSQGLFFFFFALINWYLSCFRYPALPTVPTTRVDVWVFDTGTGTINQSLRTRSVYADYYLDYRRIESLLGRSDCLDPSGLPFFFSVLTKKRILISQLFDCENLYWMVNAVTQGLGNKKDQSCWYECIGIDWSLTKAWVRVTSGKATWAILRIGKHPTQRLEKRQKTVFCGQNLYLYTCTNFLLFAKYAEITQILLSVKNTLVKFFLSKTFKAIVNCWNFYRDMCFA